MKRAPQSDERALRHLTVETGDLQSFALVDQNYDSAALRAVPSMEQAPLGGFCLDVIDRINGEFVRFDVCFASGVVVSHNTANLAPNGDILLSTTLTRHSLGGDVVMLADLEQCAAIALLGITPP